MYALATQPQSGANIICVVWELREQCSRFALAQYHPRTSVSLFLALLQKTMAGVTKIFLPKLVTILYVVGACAMSHSYYHFPKACSVLLMECETLRSSSDSILMHWTRDHPQTGFPMMLSDYANGLGLSACEVCMHYKVRQGQFTDLRWRRLCRLFPSVFFFRCTWTEQAPRTGLVIRKQSKGNGWKPTFTSGLV